MANTVRIKRRAGGGAVGAPASLQNAEVAYNESDLGNGILYYGLGTGGAGGTATSVIPIGGAGAYVSLTGSQTSANSLQISGNKDFTGTVSFGANTTGVTAATADSTTKLATTAYVKAQGYGVGSVTSVGLALPSIFSVSGSPVTGSGTLTGALASQTAATVFAAPSGAAGTPTFRALVALDIPSLTASKISDFDTQVRTSRLDQMAAPTAAVAFNTQRITGLGDPSGAQDAATKAYVDAVKTGLDVKDSVRAATTANITLSAPQTIDGVALIAGDRVLVKDQATASANGIYVVAAAAWTRSTDADNTPAGEVTGGMFTFVTEGTVNADSGWVLTTNDAIILGTTSLAFAQFSGAGQVTAGNGLTKTGNTLDVGGTANRITIAADSVDIASTYVGQTSITTLGTITSGTWTGTAIAVLNGGTGATTAANARTNLGLVIGTNVQAYDAELATLAGMAAGTATSLAALTSTEAAVIDGSTTATATTLALTDHMVINDAGTMVQVALSDLITFLEDGTASGFDLDGGTF